MMIAFGCISWLSLTGTVKVGMCIMHKLHILSSCLVLSCSVYYTEVLHGGILR